MKKIIIASFISLASLSSFAGAYSDDLGKCLVASTSTADRSHLVRWIFSMLSTHPDTAKLVSGSEMASKKVKDNLDKKAAELFEVLMTERCKTETRNAVQYEGPVAIQSGFQILGQVATQELMSHPDVMRSFDGLERHIDPKKFENLK